MPETGVEATTGEATALDASPLLLIPRYPEVVRNLWDNHNWVPRTCRMGHTLIETMWPEIYN